MLKSQQIIYKLPTVTLLAMTGLGYKSFEHIQALKKSFESIEFADVKLIQLGSITDLDSWNHAVCYELWRYFDTSHCILLHEDSEIINPELWQDKWLEYDWCSSPWPLPRWKGEFENEKGIQRVGNSVGLRSHKLLRLPSELKLDWKPFWGNFNEDGKFCVEWRTKLEENGCKFMPFEEALVFGKESELPENKDVKTFLRHQI